MKLSSVLVVLAPLALARFVPAQVQVVKLTASDMAQDAEYGAQVAISGEWAVVSSQFDDDVVSQSGACYLYRRVGSTWTEFQKIKAADVATSGPAGAQFGCAVAIEGQRVVIGALHDPGLGIW